VDIKKHSVFFFSIVRKLDSVGLDPKYDLDNEHVTIEECSFLFGGSKKFKINSPILKVEDKATMEDIYWRVFGTSIVTKNEIPAWIVRGFITHSRGHPINWAKVVESIAKKSASKWSEGWPASGSKERTYNGFFGIVWWELES
jgi:hypothetical protein